MGTQAVWLAHATKTAVAHDFFVAKAIAAALAAEWRRLTQSCDHGFMRTMALGLGLGLAVGGCDWAFGLKQTSVLPGDAGDGGEFVIPIALQWQVATTTSSGAPTTPVVTPIVPGPSVSIGPIDPTTGPGPLVAATYDLTNGTLTAPFNLAGMPYRIDYNLGQEQFEVQLDGPTGATLLVPHLSRTTAPAVPVGNSGYDILPMGLAKAGLKNPQFATSGVYTLTKVSSTQQPSPQEVQFPFSDADPMQGPLGAPQTVDGDWELLLDWTASTTDPYTITGYAITAVDLTANGLSSPQTQPTWETTTSTYTYDASFASSAAARLAAAVGSLSAYMPLPQIDYGILPSTQIVPFVAGSFGSNGGSDQALMIPLYQSNNIKGSLAVIDVDSTIAQQPRALLAETLEPRTSDGVSLTCVLESITSVDTSTMSAASLPFGAPLATKEVFAGVALDGTAGLADVPVTNGASLVLTWTTDQPTATADDFIVRLYEILSGGVTPIETYQVLSPSVTVDGGLLEANHVYVFGITARKGIPGAKNVDYSTVTFPFSEATIFPATFKIL
jgi:hypothetical protein